MSSYKDSITKVDHSNYDAIVHESDVERQFALSLDGDERIKLFVKLPSCFKVETPVGGFIQNSVEILKEFIRLDPNIINSFKLLCKQSTCFGWEDSLVRMFDER
jgi:hypothetical protein